MTIDTPDTFTDILSHPRMLDCMLDLETMGNGPHAAITAIGAVLFDDVTEQLGEAFYCRVDLASACQMGGVIDADTVQWWLRQDGDARQQVDGSQPAVHIAVALADFAEFIALHSDSRRVRMWGNGAAFDNVILGSAYRRAGIVAPWRYSNDRCYRTIRADHPDIKLQRTVVHHNALDDAISQARHLIAMRNARPNACPHADQCNADGECTTGCADRAAMLNMFPLPPGHPDRAAAFFASRPMPQSDAIPTDEELRAAYSAAAPKALAWPWPDGLCAVLRAFGGTATS